MICSFRHKGLETFFYNGNLRGIKPSLAKRLKLRLDALAAAEELRQIDLPGWELHELKGDRSGTWSIHVTENWRLTFRFEKEDAWEVNLEDYH